MANETNALHDWEDKDPVGCAAENASLIDGEASSSSRFSVSDTQGVVQQFVNLARNLSLPCSSHPELWIREKSASIGESNTLGPVIWLPRTASSNRKKSA